MDEETAELILVEYTRGRVMIIYSMDLCIILGMVYITTRKPNDDIGRLITFVYAQYLYLFIIGFINGQNNE